jgi:hypothetical protein
MSKQPRRRYRQQKRSSRSIPGASGDLFGEPSTAPSRYHCPKSGKVYLSQDVKWKGNKPYCPDDGAELEAVT